MFSNTKITAKDSQRICVREDIQFRRCLLSLISHYRVRGSAKVVAISSCGNIMNEYSREGATLGGTERSGELSK